MWNATILELIKNDKTENKNAYYFQDCYTLNINGVRITNTIQNPKEYKGTNDFQSYVCNWCGIEHCEQGNMLMFRKFKDCLLVLPTFEFVNVDEEYVFDIDDGSSDFPPQKWFTDGCLVIEGDALLKLYELIPGLQTSKIPHISPAILDAMFVWELLVLKKPEGFIKPE
jgi:hypothetical protein